MIRNFLNLLEKVDKKDPMKQKIKVVGNAIGGPLFSNNGVDCGTTGLMEWNSDKPFLVHISYSDISNIEKNFSSIDDAKKFIISELKSNYLKDKEDRHAVSAIIQDLSKDQRVVGSWSAKKGWSSSDKDLTESTLTEEDKGPWDAAIKKNISELNKEEEMEESLNESTTTHLEVAFSTPEESGYDSRLVKEFKNISKEDALKQAKKEIDIKSVYTKGDSMFAKVAWAGSWDGYDPMVRIGETEDVLNTIGVDSSDDAEWELTNNWDKYEDIFFFDVEEDVEDYEESLEEKIVKKSDGYYVQSEKGKNLGGPYKNKIEAQKRLDQVHYFSNRESLNEEMSFDDWVEEQGMDINDIEENPDLEKYYRREYKDSLAKKTAVDDDFYDCFIIFTEKPSYNEFIKYMSRKYTKDQLNNKDFMADEYKNFLDYHGFKESLTEAKADQQKFIDKFGQENFDKFVKYKQRLKNKNISTDILWHVKNTEKGDMDSIISELDNTLSKTQKAKEDVVNGADLIYKDDNWKVYHVHTYDAAAKLGSGTTWCITGRYGGATDRGEYYFNDYVRRYGLDDYYFIFDLNNRDSATGDYLKYCAGVTKDPRKLVFLYNGMQDREIKNDGIPGVPRENRIQPISGIRIPYDSIELINGCRIKDDKIVSASNAYGDIVLPNYITEIPEGAFYNSRIQSIVIPDSVTIIDEKAFADCQNLKSVKLPKSIKTIEHATFFLCESLEEVVIPEGIETIGSQAFMDCSSLKQLNLPSSLKNIDYEAFSYCTSLENVTIPEGVLNIKANAFKNCILNTLTLPRSIQTFAKSDCQINEIIYNGSQEDWLGVRTNYRGPITFTGGSSDESVSESLHEDWYDEDQFFTRDDLSEYVEEPLETIIKLHWKDFNLRRAYIEPGNILEVDWEYKDYEDTSKVKIDMRSIRKPVDLCKYGMKIMHIILDKIKEIDPELGESFNKSLGEKNIMGKVTKFHKTPYGFSEADYRGFTITWYDDYVPYGNYDEPYSVDWFGDESFYETAEDAKRDIDKYLEQNESLTESDSEEESRYERIKGKSVMDTDGFYTDYTMYYDTLLDKYVFVFGDEELYSPGSGNFDWECDSEQEANEWFNDYNGYDEYEEEHAWLDDMVDQEGKKESISEDFDSELGKNYIGKTVYIKLKDGSKLIRKVLEQGNRAQGHEVLVVEDPINNSKMINVDDIASIRRPYKSDSERGPIEKNNWSDTFNSLL